MKQRRRRGGDAEQNRSNWDKLLNTAKSLLSDSKELKQEIEGSTDRVEEAWDQTATDVERTQSDVAQTIDRQASERQTEADFDSGAVAGPARAVSEGESVHGGSDFPSQSDYELSEPVSAEEVEATVNETEQQPAVEPETPTPYTEKEWFTLHADQFPISEEVFPVDIGEQASEGETDDEERRAERESADRREQDEGNRERDT